MSKYVKWDLNPAKKLQNFDVRMRTNTQKRALRAAANVNKDQLKSVAPRGESGLLRRSMAIKVKVKKGGIVGYALAGARKKWKQQFEGVEKQPSRYQSIVEKGRRGVFAINKKVLANRGHIFGVYAQPTIGSHFIESTAMVSVPQAQGAYMEVVNAAIRKELLS